MRLQILNLLQDLHKWHKWIPFGVVCIFVIGLLSTILMRGQEPNAFENSLAITRLQEDYRDMASLPSQMEIVRNDVQILKEHDIEHSKKLDHIDTVGDWIVFGVFGILITQIVKGIRFPRDKSDNEFPLLKV